MEGDDRERALDEASPHLRLRLIVADEQSELLEQMAEMARSLGHDVVAHAIAPSAVARAVRVETPELVIVGLHEDEEHALDLIREIVDEEICPVIVQTRDTDPQFAAQAAERGIFALASTVDADALQAAIEVAVRRFGEFEELGRQIESLEGALQRRALVERAKGIIMERQGIGERAAYELLRSRARATSQPLVAVAESVLESHSSATGPAGPA
jgi:AmiR/NasT family two-component response regulator